MAMAGPPESTGAEGGEINCANPDISADNLRIVRPPAPADPETDELPEPAVASGMVPVGSVLTAMDPVAAVGDCSTLMDARGTAVPILLLCDDGSLD